LRFFKFSKEIWNITAIRPQPLPSRSFSINHLCIILLLDNI
jgi:hypothetical protein